MDSFCRVVAFRELLALVPERIDAQLAIAKEHLKGGAAEEARILTRGLSPHAPYSVHPDLFHQLVALCKEHNAPLAMHLAETRAELDLLEKGTGEFVEMLSTFGVWREGLIPQNTRIRDYLEPLAALDRALVVHGNYLSDDDIAFLAKHPQLTVVYCPRTHVYFGHKNHPWPRLLDAGVRVALGTDSRASNPDLNLWEEVKFLRRKHPHVPPSQWLEWATRNGAMALYGPETKLGTLAIGYPACFSVVWLADPEKHDPYASLLG
jgi:cytosine/adenosine deaminase-related metal-dependent hydrolase